MGASLRIEHAGAVRSATELAGELAARQFGALARWQLLERGFTRSRIAHWIEAGRLHPRYRGVYAWGRPELGTAGDLAAGILYAGAGSALASISALWWLELLHRRPVLIHLDAPGRRASHRDLRIRHPARFERCWHRGLPVVPLAQALLTASDTISHDSLRLVLARAEFKRILSLPSLQGPARRDGRPPAAARPLRERLRA